MSGTPWTGANSARRERWDTFSLVMCEMGLKQSWIIVSMENDWGRIFAFDQRRPDAGR